MGDGELAMDVASDLLQKSSFLENSSFIVKRYG